MYQHFLGLNLPHDAIPGLASSEKKNCVEHVPKIGEKEDVTFLSSCSPLALEEEK